MKRKGRGMTLVVLNMFIGLTAVAGGIGLLTGGLQMPLELLRNSPFSSYAIPGLVLAVVVGGSALAAAVMLLMRQKAAVIASTCAGLFMVGFEIVEALMIDRSVTSLFALAIVLQVFYTALGLLIFNLAGYLWLAEDRYHPTQSGSV